MSFNRFCLTSLLVFLGFQGNAWGWGRTAHKFINQYAVPDLPPAMSLLSAQQAFLVNHASDADNRKSTDTAEAPKHFIDLESYPDYQHLPRDLASLISQYGWNTVKGIGILPWATVWALDSLTAQMRRGDWTKAYQTAADIGHYVGDGHQPLHCTVNYDGYQTGNAGIHSRYETGMIDLFQTSLAVTVDTVRYISDPYSYLLNSEIHARSFIDSIMRADNAAKSESGWNGSGTVPTAYYNSLWQHTQRFTLQLMQEATSDIASLWYTAWVNAGLNVTFAAEATPAVPNDFRLAQNFPNPFNPETTISFQLPVASTVKLVFYDVLGREIARLVDEPRAAGAYSVRFSGTGISSGSYFYRLSAVPTTRQGLAPTGGSPGAEFVQTKRMILLR
jgi:hypothetical protein